jgi:hypothetical protein
MLILVASVDPVTPRWSVLRHDASEMKLGTLANNRRKTCTMKEDEEDIGECLDEDPRTKTHAERAVHLYTQFRACKQPRSELDRSQVRLG